MSVTKASEENLRLQQMQMMVALLEKVMSEKDQQIKTLNEKLNEKESFIALLLEKLMHEKDRQIKTLEDRLASRKELS